jgi:hypothetical protein
MTTYTVTGYHRTIKMMRVEAESEEEAVEKAMRGEYDDVDTDPGPDLYRPKWTAEEGWRGK